MADFYQALEGLKRPNDNEDIMVREGTDKKVLPVREAYAYYSNMDNRTSTGHGSRFESLGYLTKLTVLHG